MAKLMWAWSSIHQLAWVLERWPRIPTMASWCTWKWNPKKFQSLSTLSTHWMDGPGFGSSYHWLQSLWSCTWFFVIRTKMRQILFQKHKMFWLHYGLRLSLLIYLGFFIYHPHSIWNHIPRISVWEIQWYVSQFSPALSPVGHHCHAHNHGLHGQPQVEPGAQNPREENHVNERDDRQGHVHSHGVSFHGMVRSSARKIGSHQQAAEMPGT